MTRRQPRIPPLLQALALQGIALLLSFSAATLLHQQGYTFTLLALAGMSGLIAALLSHFIGMRRWWLPIQLLLPSLAWGILQLDLSPHWFLAAFLLVLAFYWSSFRGQVPFYLSSLQAVQALNERLPQGTSFRFLDLGAGMGGLLLQLAALRPDGQFEGIESAPLPWLIGRLRIKLSNRHQVTLHHGDLWQCDLVRYDVVYAYLSPVPMAALWDKAKREMRPGTLFISNTFAVPDVTPHETLQLDDLHDSVLHIWRM